MDKNYFSLKNFALLAGIFLFFFGFLFFLSGILIDFKASKTAESFAFLANLFFIFLAWGLYVRKKLKSGDIEAIENNDFGARENKIKYSFLLFPVFIFVFIYVGLAFLGNSTGLVPASLFGVYKEFGHHLDAISRIAHGFLPWIDFSYPYGYYPILFSYLLWQLHGNADALIVSHIILNIAAVVIFSFALARYAGKKYFLFGMLCLLIYLSPMFLSNFYSGIHSNWLRYISPLLIFLFIPFGEYQRLKTFLWGFCVGAIFFITPELLPFSLVAIPLSLFYLRKNNFKNYFFVIYFGGLLLSLLPFLVFVDSIRSLPEIFGNIFYQAKFIINYNQLAISLPNWIKLLGGVISSPSIDSLKFLIFGILFYLPLFLAVWLFGAFFAVRNIGMKFSLIFSILAILAVFSKALGFSSLGYAWMPIPICIFILAKFFDFLPAEQTGKNIVAAVFLFSIALVSAYGMQQQYLSCLISQDDVCQQDKEIKKYNKVSLSEYAAGKIQKFNYPEVHKMESILDFLEKYGDKKIKVLADMTVFNYFTDTPSSSRIMLPSLYFEKKDIEQFDSVNDINIIIVAQKGFNFLEIDLENKFPNIHAKLKSEFMFAGSCGPLDFYINKTIDESARLQC